MNATATALEREILQSLFDFQAYTYASLAALVLLFYDTILTLPDEIELVWRGEFRTGVFLYFSTRYCGIVLLLILVLNLNTNLSIPICNALNYFTGAMSTLAGLGVHGILLGRAYAVGWRSRWIMLGVMWLFLQLTAITIAHIPFSGCEGKFLVQLRQLRVQQNDHPSYTPSNYCSRYIVTDVAVLLFDTSILAVTIHHAWSLRKVQRMSSRGNPTMSLAELIVRQGIIRFIIIFAWTIEGSIGNAVLRTSIASVDSPLQNAVSSILICRFFLDLRKSNRPPENETQPFNVTTSTNSNRPVSRPPGRWALWAKLIDEFGDKNEKKRPEAPQRSLEEQRPQDYRARHRDIEAGPSQMII